MNTRSIDKMTSRSINVGPSLAGITLGMLGAYTINHFIGHPLSYKINYPYDFLTKITTILAGAYIGYQFSTLVEDKNTFGKTAPMDYFIWKKILQGKRLPAAIVDLDAFDRNLETLAKTVNNTGKTIRIATKSIRVPDLILRALAKRSVFRGLMCYTVEEACFLYSLKMNDLLIAYPTLQPSDLKKLRKLHEAGAKVSLVLDSLDQMEMVADAMQGARAPLPIIIEMDMSLRLFGGLIHLGVRRSPVRTLQELKTILEMSRDYASIKVIGVMAYEAAVAGLMDRNPFKKTLNLLASLVRIMSIWHVAKLRAQIPEIFKAAGIPLEIFNGGGTGSLEFAAHEEVLTEVTSGSGLLCPHLFDYYSNLRESRQFEPAAFFALQTVRISDPGYVTCSGGGYIASGEPGWDRLPMPVLPVGLQFLNEEACGEVQTPLKVNGSIAPTLGGPALFRPAKAGELAEHFNEYLLVADEKIVARAKTYRGLGYSFL